MIPFSYDPNQVVGQLLGATQCEINQLMTVNIVCTDPQGDPFIITQTGALGLMIVKENGAWRLQWTPNAEGIYYCLLEAEDIPPAGKIPRKSRATVIINVLGANSAPVFLPLEDTVAISSQIRYQGLKKLNTYIVGTIDAGHLVAE